MSVAKVNLQRRVSDCDTCILLLQQHVCFLHLISNLLTSQYIPSIKHVTLFLVLDQAPGNYEKEPRDTTPGIPRLVRPLDVVAPKEVGKATKEVPPPFVAPDKWLELVCQDIQTNLDAIDNSEERVRPMALVRCSRGGKTRTLYEIASSFKRDQKEVAVIFVTFNDFSPVQAWEQADPRAALCRRIAFAAMKGRDFENSLDQYKDFASAQVTPDEITTWLNGTSCLLLIDELNLLVALTENKNEAARNLSDMLKLMFLKPRGVYFVFSSRVVSTTHELSAYLEPSCERKLDVRQLPLIPSITVAKRDLKFPKLDARQALFYGLVPALILEGKSVAPEAHEAIQTWIRAGIDNKKVLSLLTTFIDGDSNCVPQCLLQMMDTFQDATEQRLVRWIPYHMIAVLLGIQQHVEGDLQSHLLTIVDLFKVFKGSKEGSGDGWDALFVIVLLVRVLTRGFNNLINLKKITTSDFRVTYNEPFVHRRLLLAKVIKINDFLKGVPKDVPKGGQISIYYPENDQFEMYDVIVVVWNKAGHRESMIGYQLRERRAIPSKMPRGEFTSSFVIRGKVDRGTNKKKGWTVPWTKKKNEWTVPSTDEITSFFGISGGQWTPEKWNALYKGKGW